MCPISYNSNDIQSKCASAQEAIENGVGANAKYALQRDAIFYERSKRNLRAWQKKSDLTHANMITVDGNDGKLIRCTFHMWIMGRRETNEVSSMQTRNEIVMANCNMRYSLVYVCGVRSARILEKDKNGEEKKAR